MSVTEAIVPNSAVSRAREPVLSVVASKFRDGSVRRFLFVAAVAFWLGGFTFYGSAVIPSGMDVLHSHLRMGFITQRVTGWLNVSGVIALLIFLWNLLALRPMMGRRTRIIFAVSLAVMMLIEVELFVLHPIMDRLLDPTLHVINDDDRFDLLHHVYLISSTGQWVAGVVYVWCSVAARPG